MTRDRAESDRVLRYIAIIGAICAVAVLAHYVVGLHGPLPLPLDRNGVPLGRDFVNTWFYGRAFFDVDPARFYDRTLYTKAVRAVFPNDYVDPLWSYSPPFLILAAPFGKLAYVPALAAWTLVGLVSLGLVVRTRGSFWLIAAVLTAPTVVFALVAGQLSLLVAVVIIFVLAQLDRRPVLAGLALCLLVIKPQAALLFPVFLVASRRWTVLIAAAAGALALLALSITLNGIAPWIAFVHLGLPAQMAEMKATAETLAPISVTVTTAAMKAGLPPSIVTWLQAGATMLAVGIVAWIGWRRRPGTEGREREGQIILLCSTFATPYLLLHDLVPLAAVSLVAAARGGPLRNRFALLALLYLPIAQSLFASAHICILPICAIGLAVWLTVKHNATWRSQTDGALSMPQAPYLTRSSPTAAPCSHAAL